MTHLVLFLVLQVATDPFFTNDIKGAIRLGGLVLSILGPMFFVVFRLVFNSTTEKVKAMEANLNGYGERLGRQETSTTACSTEVGALKSQLSRHEIEVRNIGLSQAKVETRVEEMARQQVELQKDVMSAVTESGRQLTLAMTALQIEVAKLTERNKFGDALSEIADIMRENRRQVVRAALDREGEPRGRS